MRIWLIGAGKLGMNALRQLQKNPDLEIVVSDPINNPEAVQMGLIPRVDYVEQVNSANINSLARRVRPDLILLSPGATERGLRSLEGGHALAQALNYEIANQCDYPVIILSHSN
jgi:hypothetical protein